MNTKKIKVTNALPDKDEQLQLRETQSLMSSNMLQLQLTEMLEAAKYEHLSEKRKRTVQTWLADFLADLKTAGSEVADTYVTKSWLDARNVRMDLEDRGDVQSSLVYQQPETVTMIGSYVLKTIVRPNCSVDVAISMPSTCFDKRDILNHVYFDKRKLYLGVLLYFLKLNAERLGIENIEIVYLKNDSRKPILVLRPIGLANISVRIYPTITSGCFACNQLRLEKNNVRPKWWMTKLKEIRNEQSTPADASLDPSLLRPTPHYNMAILEDMAIIPEHNLLSDVISSSPFLRDVIISAKVWLSKRGHRYGFDSLDGHLSSVLIVKLFQDGLITSKMSVLAAFMSYLNCVSSMTCKDSTSVAGFPISIDLNIRRIFGFSSDITGTSNYISFWRVSESSLEQIRSYAASSLAVLQSSTSFDSTGQDSCFSKVFLKSVNFLVEYDFLLHIPIVSRMDVLNALETRSDQNTGPEEAHTSGASNLDAIYDFTELQFVSFITRTLLLKALGNRVTCIHSCPNTICSGYATLGFRYDISNCHRRVDRGPPAENEKGCQEYRDFWGKITRLRRFRDGSIVESIVWGEGTDSSTGQASLYADEVTFEIVSHILARHMPLHKSKGILAPSLSFGEVLPRSSMQHTHLCGQATSVILHRQLVEALDSLRQKLTSDLKDFPLNIDGIRGMHSSLRYTSYLPPTKHPIVEMSKSALNSCAGKSVNRIVEAVSIVAVFGLSSKWPTKMSAIHSVKSALIIRIARCLKKQFEIHSVVHESCLDVFYSGYIFRMHLYVANELALLENDKNRSSNDLELCFCRSLLWAPLHNAAIHAMCGKNEAFADTVRLFSCWIDCNMLSGYVQHDVLELIVAHTFITGSANIGPVKPAAPSSSFLFAFLKTLLIISEFDWTLCPMIVDFGAYLRTENQSPTTDDMLKRVDTSFRNIKQHESGSTMVIAAIYNDVNGFDENYCTRFIDCSVVSVLLQRVQLTLQTFLNSHAEVASSVQPFKKIVAAEKGLKFNVVLKFQRFLAFGEGLGDATYDAVVQGSESCHVKVYTNLSPQYANGSHLISRNESLPHPLQMELVNKLRCRFDDAALFFYNHINGDEIGVIWKPLAFFPKGFSMLYTRNYCVCPGYDSAGDTVVVNPASIVAEMIALSDGLISEAKFC